MSEGVKDKKSCRFFSKGRCRNGANCTFLHFDSTKKASPSKRARDPSDEGNEVAEKKQKTDDKPEDEVAATLTETETETAPTSDAETEAVEGTVASDEPTVTEEQKELSTVESTNTDDASAGDAAGTSADQGESESAATEVEAAVDTTGTEEENVEANAGASEETSAGEPAVAEMEDMGPVLEGVFGGASLEKLQAAQMLVLGDGNMSFSLALAQRLGTDGTWQMHATTLDTRAVVERKYKGSLETMDALRKLEPKVWTKHEIAVGCLNHLACFRGKTFNTLIWNFPVDERLGRTETNSDARVELVTQLLITLFFQSSTMLVQGGHIHLTLDSKSRIFNTVIQEAKKSSFTLVGHSVLKFEDWPGYETRCEKEDREVKITGEPITLTFQQAQNSEEVFVGNVATRMTGKVLERHFSVCGTILTARVMRNKGFAFVRFTSPESARKAVRDLNHSELLDKKITVEFSKMQPPLRPNPVPCRHYPDGPDMAVKPDRRRPTSARGPLPRGRDRERNISWTREPLGFRDRPLPFAAPPPMRFREPRYRDELEYEQLPPRRVVMSRRSRVVYPEPEVDYMPVYLPRERSRSPRPLMYEDEVVRRKRPTPPPSRYATDAYRVADISPPRGAPPRAQLRPVRGEGGFTSEPFAASAEPRRRVMVARKPEPLNSRSSYSTPSAPSSQLTSRPPLPARQPTRSADYSHYLDY